MVSEAGLVEGAGQGRKTEIQEMFCFYDYKRIVSDVKSDSKRDLGLLTHNRKSHTKEIQRRGQVPEGCGKDGKWN